MTPLYAGIGGVVRELTEMDAGINGVVKPMTEMWAGVDGVNRQIFSSGIRVGDLAIGDVVQLNESGVAQDYLCVHQGLPSSLYDDSCDGTWLLRKELSGKRVWDSGNISAYAESDINVWMNSAMLDVYDDRIKSGIKQVKIPYCLGNGNRTVMSGSNGLSCKAFLLSMPEVGVSDTIVDGAKLDYFLDGMLVDARQKRIARWNGSASSWWSRSPWGVDPNTTVCVDSDGSKVGYAPSGNSGIRPCIILPQDFVL